MQDDGFPILSVDKPGWWWVVHTCNEVYKLSPPVKEETVKELMPLGAHVPSIFNKFSMVFNIFR